MSRIQSPSSTSPRSTTSAKESATATRLAASSPSENRPISTGSADPDTSYAHSPSAPAATAALVAGLVGGESPETAFSFRVPGDDR